MLEWRREEAALEAQLAEEEDRLQSAAREARQRGYDAAYNDGEADGSVQGCRVLGTGKGERLGGVG